MLLWIIKFFQCILRCGLCRHNLTRIHLSREINLILWKISSPSINYFKVSSISHIFKSPVQFCLIENTYFYFYISKNVCLFYLKYISLILCEVFMHDFCMHLELWHIIMPKLCMQLMVYFGFWLDIKKLYFRDSNKVIFICKKYK